MARGKVLAMPVLAGWEGGAPSGMTPLRASIWPNEGLGYAAPLDAGAVYAQGRTKGPPPRCHVCEGTNKSTAQSLCGANVSLAQQPLGEGACGGRHRVLTASGTRRRLVP